MPALPERLPKPLDEPARDRLLEALPADTLAQKRDRAFILFALSTAPASRKRCGWTATTGPPAGCTWSARATGNASCSSPIRPRRRSRTIWPPVPILTGPVHRLLPARMNSRGNRLPVSGAEHLCRQLALRLGITTFHPHRLRHPFWHLAAGNHGQRPADRRRPRSQGLANGSPGSQPVSSGG